MSSYDEIVLENNGARVGISTQGGYLSSWQLLAGQGEWRDVLYQGSALKRSGIPILFPYFGKAEKWPQHGFGRQVQWRVAEQTESRVVMELRSEDLGEEVRSWYPYTFVTRIGIEIGVSGELLYSLEVKNIGDNPMPICPGLHPYWPIRHGDKKSIRIEGAEGFDAESIDWEHSPPDNRYDFSQKVVISFPDRRIVIEDVSETPVVKHLVVWSQTPVRDPDYNFVCIEPIVGYNYDIDRNPVLVSSGEKWEMRVKVTLLFA